MAEPVDASPAAEPAEGESPAVAGLKADIKWAAALMLLVVVAVSSLMSRRWWAPAAGREELSGWTDAFGRDRPGLTEELFTQWVVPFELLSVLLLAALIAAIVIAIRERED